MFGRPSFGVSQPSTFGFGSTSTAPFGQTSQLFGNTSNSFGTSSSGFGSATPSMFGSPQQAATPLFGTSTTSSFGPGNQSGFGSALFGNSPQQAPGTSLFGNSANSSFGQQNKPSGFGFSSGSTSGLFGQNATQTPQSASMFQTSNNLFGPSGSFGSSSGQTGTVIKFSPVTGTDSMQKSGVAHTISTKHHCITCMKEYENKSLEELRWEDYQLNRKGPQQSGFGTAQPFGVTASTTPALFGQTENKTVFGQTAPGFGQPIGFGSQTTTPNIFGKPTTGFGTTTTAANTFGFGTNTSSTGGLFGTNTAKFVPANQSFFGATQPQQNAFGNTNLFGQPNAQNTGDLFGKSAQPTGFNSFSFGTGQQSLFQNPKPNNAFNIFGQTPTSNTGFGQPQQQQQSNFGFVPFGKPAQNTFGQPNVFGLGGGNLFANNTIKPVGGLFGNTSSNSFFAGNNNFQPNTGFLMPNQMQQMVPNQNAVPTTENLDLGSMLQVTDPYGYNPHLEGLSPLKPMEAGSYTTNPKEIQKFMDIPQPIAIVSPLNKRMKVMPRPGRKSIMFDDSFDNVTEINFGLRSAAKRLVLRKDRRPPDIVVVQEGVSEMSLPTVTSEDSETDSGCIKLKPANRPHFARPQFTFTAPTELEDDYSDKCSSIDRFDRGETKKDQPINNVDKPAVSITDDVVISPEPEEGYSLENDSPREVNGTNIDTCGVVMTRHDYYTVPALDKLSDYKQPDGACLIKGFTIGRIGFGSVSFPDLIDVCNLNIDELVHFRCRELTIYPDDTKKPPLGQELNRRAQVTLDRVFPKDKVGRLLITDVDSLIEMNFIDTLKNLCRKHGTKFLDYRPDTGSWVFMVEHFSKYAFTDPNDEDDSEAIEKIEEKQIDEKKLSEEKMLQARETENKIDVIEDEDTTSKEILICDEESNMKIGLGGFSEIGDDIEDIDIDLSDALSSDDLRHIKSKRSLYKDEGNLLYLMKATLFDMECSSDIGYPDVEMIESRDRLIDELMEHTEPEIILKPGKIISLKPEVFTLCNTIPGDIPKNKCIFNSRSYMDMAVFKHRSFKVGWGRGLTLATTLSPVTTKKNFVNDSFLKNYSTSVMIIDVSDLTKRNIFEDFESDYLRIVLEESDIELVDGIPLLKVKYGKSMLLRHHLLVTEIAEYCYKEERQYYKEIWDLCLAFWGPIERPINRRQLFSEWLEGITRKKIYKELSLCNNYGVLPALQKIFIHLTGHQILEAAQVAMNKKMPKLSLLLSQLNMNSVSKSYMKEQLDQWRQAEVLEHISTISQKIYMTLSGIPTSMDDLQHGCINICENLDWKRALAMYLWYVIPDAYPLNEAVKSFHDSFTTYGYLDQPKPKHLKNNGENIFDIQYNIILLFSDIKKSLEDILDPATHSDFQVDYRLSWLLLQTFESLSVGVINSNAKDYIITSFSQQLENIGYYKWSVFVLLYIKDNSLKRNLVMGVLDRNLKFDLSDIDIEDDLVEDLHLPAEWIHIVKANKTSTIVSRYWETYIHLLYSNNWLKCHVIAINVILPELMINENYEIMKNVLNSLIEGSEQILNWKYQAGLLVNFIQLLEIFKNKSEITNKSALNIHSLLVEFCMKLKTFPTNNPKQVACLSELSKHCANFIKIILTYMSPSYDGILTTFIQTPSFMMPPDYKIDVVGEKRKIRGG